MMRQPQSQELFDGYYYHHQEVFDKIEFDDNKADQALDINKALENLRKEKKRKGEQEKEMQLPDIEDQEEPIPENSALSLSIS